MRRQRALMAHALGALRRRGARNAAISVGLAIVVALFSSTMFLAEALRAEERALAEGMPDLSGQRLVAGRPALLDPASVAEIASLPGVRSVRARVWGYLYVAALEGNAVVVSVPQGASETEYGALSSGRLPQQDDEVVLGSALAREVGARVDDVVVLSATRDAQGDVEPLILRVSGLASGRTAILDADLVLATPGGARRLLGVPAGLATDVAVELARPEEAAVVTAALGELLPSARVVDRQLVSRTWELTFEGRGGLVGAMLLPALAAMLLLAWDRLTGLGEAERREIGVLKAVGWSTGDVLAARMWESFLVALLGATLGVTLAYVHVFALGAPGLWDAMLGWSVLHAPATLTPSVDPAQVLAIVGAVVMPFVAISVVPAWRTAMMDPEQALRGGSA